MKCPLSFLRHHSTPHEQTHTFCGLRGPGKVGTNITETNWNKNAIRRVICLLAHLAMTFWNLPLFRRQRQMKPLVKYTHWFTGTKKSNLSGSASHLHYKDRPISYRSKTKTCPQFHYLLLSNYVAWKRNLPCCAIKFKLQFFTWTRPFTDNQRFDQQDAKKWVGKLCKRQDTKSHWR